MHLFARQTLFALFPVVVLLNPTLVMGLASDRDQPVVVTADRSEHSEVEQRQILTGNVVIKQGSLLIHADKVIIYLKQGELDKVDANGAPARFQQLDEANQLVKGHSLRVEYASASGQLTLTGDAFLENPAQSVKGQRIDYNLNTQSAVAEGGDERVNIVIQPAKKNTDGAQ